jgi:small subunit ribosomal protein S13
MLLIFGVTLPKDKKVLYALPKLYGIGKASALKICNELGFSPELKIKDLIGEQQFLLAKKVKEEYRLEDNLREEVKSDVRRYISNGSIRGGRHKNHLPVRGQRTKSNARTPRRVIQGLSSRSKN